MKNDTSIDLSGLPRLAAWAKLDPQVTPLTWLYSESDLETAVAFTALFWPDVIEHQGGVFLREFFDVAVFVEWQKQLGDDIGAIERAMNHRYIHDLLRGGDRVGFQNLCHLGNVLAATWRSRLNAAFPNRTFEVSCWQDVKNDEAMIAFWQPTLLRNSTSIARF